MSPPTGQIVSSVKLSDVQASTINVRSQSQDCFRSLNIFIDLVGNEFSVSFRLARILKVIYLMSLNLLTSS